MSLADIKARSRPSALTCPECGGQKIGCINTRPADGKVKRRRLCTDCDARFSTVEVFHSAKSMTVGPYDLLNTDAMLLRRWLEVHDIRSMGERAVKETA